MADTKCQNGEKRRCAKTNCQNEKVGCSNVTCPNEENIRTPSDKFDVEVREEPLRNKSIISRMMIEAPVQPCPQNQARDADGVCRPVFN